MELEHTVLDDLTYTSAWDTTLESSSDCDDPGVETVDAAEESLVGSVTVAARYDNPPHSEDHGEGRVNRTAGGRLGRLPLLSREQEQRLGRDIRDSRLEMTAALSQIPAAFGTIATLMMAAETGERPSTDAFFAPFEGFHRVPGSAFDGRTHGEDDMNWREVAHYVDRLYRDWRRLVASGADKEQISLARSRLTTTARRVRPGFVALAEALRICSDLDRRVGAIESELNAFHADILTDYLPCAKAALPLDELSGLDTPSLASVWQDRRERLQRIRSEAGVDLTTLRDSCERAAAAHQLFIQAREHMTNANLGLAYSMANRLRGHGVSFEDLVQEALIGLMRAAEKFDYRKGYKFSTYAVQWIRQALTRAIADSSRTIRVAAHVHDDIVRLRKFARALEQRQGKEPSFQELAQASGLPAWKVERALRNTHEPLSLDVPPAAVEDSPLSSMIADPTVEDPRATAHDAGLFNKIARVLDRLPPREALIVRLRFGIDRTDVHTLEEIGKLLGITRERTRQLEKRAFKELRKAIGVEYLQGLDQ